MVDTMGAILVIGAGVGGIKASLDLADAGFKVYLTDRSSGIGGTVLQLEHWFPDNQCELCKLLPVFSRDECSQFCLRRDLAHPNIELLPNATVEKVTGEAGNFEVTLNIESRWVREDTCTGCGLCAGVCPVEVPDEFNQGMQNRKAIYLRSPQAIPNVYTVDRKACIKCGKCVEICPTQAINLSLLDESRKLDVGAIVVSTGTNSFDATQLRQYGFGRYANVMNNLQLERLLASGGKTQGRLIRSSDGKAPRRVAFLQCIGSRDMKHNYCSYACCMYALKEAMLIKEQNPQTEVTIFYMDMRTFGKGYYRYYLRAEEMGVKFTRCRVSTVRENPVTRNLTVLACAEDGRPVSVEFDLLVLSVGQCPPLSIAKLSQVLGVETNQWGFIRTRNFYPAQTTRDGIYVCGPASPSDISETVIQASAAACEATVQLSSTRNQPAIEKTGSREPHLDEEAKIAVLVCGCGGEISSVVDIEQVKVFARALPSVVHVQNFTHLCMPDTLKELKQTISRSGANRVILAACAPYHFQKLFSEIMDEAGIIPSLWQLVNFREQISWVHKESKNLATDKAKRALAMATQRLRDQEPLSVSPTPINPQGLVVGGGISGLVSALNLAEQGFEIHLVEKSAELGGHVKDMHYCLGNEDPQAFLSSICEKVRSNPRIHLHLGTEVLEMTGHAGNFKTQVKDGDAVIPIEHGALIIATGADEYQPTEYMYGRDERIITQKELQKQLVAGKLDRPLTVVMIQCVGFRDSNHPYCSRTCCSEAITNALKIKEQSPENQVFILNRDIMTYGLKDEYYTQAREAGVVFVRYELENKPEVSAHSKKLLIRAYDSAISSNLEIEADLLVLSTGVVAGNNSKLAEIFSLELTEDGFIKELDTKFRPVEAIIDSIFICGLANAPRYIDEEVAQAQAVAQRAGALLGKEQLKSGRIVSEVNARRCSGCGVCVTVCPYNARRMDEENKTAVVDEALCQGCGVCAALCPNGAAKLRGLKEKQVFSMIDAAL